MTAKEAMEIRNDMEGYKKCNPTELHKVIDEALEKQIPKKPILKSGESVIAIDYADGHGEMKMSKWQDWVCPVCGWFVGKRFNADQRKPHDQRKSCYCNECGQHIDWSVEKDEKQ